MATPITWSGAASVTAASTIDSDPIALPLGTVGFSATVLALGGSPSGIGGNLQIAVSNTGLDGFPTLLPGPLSVFASNGIVVAFPFSFRNSFFNFALLRWTQAGPDAVGTLFDSFWSITLSPPGPTPVPPGPAGPPGFLPPSRGNAPATASQLSGYFNALFANRWVQPPGQSS